MADMVNVTCYGKTEQMERRYAISFYREGYYACEGSEQDRYSSILFGLEHGFKDVNDDWEYGISEDEADG